MSGVATLPRWQCASCPSWTYSAGRPDGWKWATGGLICPGCQLDRLHGRKPPKRRLPHQPKPTRRVPRAKVRHVCQGCGVEFEGGPTAKYHSASCRKRAQYRKHLTTCTCQGCGATFQPAHWRSRYCNHDVSQPRPMGAAEGAEPMTTKRWCAYCGSRLADEVDDPLQVVDIACPDCQAKGLSRRVVRSRPDRSARQDPRRRANTRRRRKR